MVSATSVAPACPALDALLWEAGEALEPLLTSNGLSEWRLVIRRQRIRLCLLADLYGVHWTWGLEAQMSNRSIKLRTVIASVSGTFLTAG